MTVSNETSRWEYDGDGSTKNFTYNNRIFQDSDLEVFVDGSLQTLSTDYTVTGAGDVNGGEVQFVTAPANNTEVTIVRDVANTQGSNYPSGGPLSSDTLEDDFDRRTIVSQELQEILNRTIKIPKTDQGSPTVELAAKAIRADKFLKFDASGNVTAVSGATPDTFAADVADGSTAISQWQDQVSASFASSTSFTVDADITGDHNDANGNTARGWAVGDVVRVSGSATGVVTGTISAISFSTDTTVTLTDILDSTGASATLSNESLTALVGVVSALATSAPGQVIYVPPVTTGAATRIQGAVDALGAAGGGRVQLGAGTYDISTTQIANTFANVEIVGVGKATVIEYSGTDSAVFMGSTTQGDYRRNQRLADVFVQCTDKASQVVGVELRNCIHFALENITTFGANDPNAAEPLKGAGIHITEQSFIGRLSKIDSRLWDDGIRISTDGAATFDTGWAAAIEIAGGGEIQNNDHGITITGTGGNATGSMISIRDVTVEANYEGGINAEQGNKVLVDGVYFEANAGFNVLFGDVVAGTLSNCNQVASPLLTTPYGSVTYQAHVVVESSTSTNIFSNNFALSSGTTPIIEVQAGATATRIENNRLASSTLTADQFISDAASDTVIRENHGLSDIVWEAASLENSWANVGGSHANAGFALDKTRKERRVHLRGHIDTGAAGTDAFTLPAGYRPDNRQLFAIAGGGSVATVLRDGSVNISTKSTSEVNLAGVSFFLNQ